MVHIRAGPDPGYGSGVVIEADPCEGESGKLLCQKSLKF